METPQPDPEPEVEVDVIEDLDVSDDQVDTVSGGDHTGAVGYGNLDG